MKQCQKVKTKLSEVIQSTKQYTFPQTSFIEFLKNFPLFGEKLVFERDKSPCRKIEL